MKNYKITAVVLMVSILPASSLFPLDTTIKGGKMQLLDKGNRVVFSKGVTMKRGTDTIISKKMVTNKKRDKVQVFGKVRLERTLKSGEKWYGYGKEGFYDTEGGTGYLLGGFKRARMVYHQVLSSTSTRKIEVFSKRFDFTDQDKNIVGTGKVYATSVDPDTQDQYEFWSEKAVYNDLERKLVLTGKKQPKVKQTSGQDKKIIYGDVITYYIDKEQFISEGQAEAIFIDSKEEPVEN